MPSPFAQSSTWDAVVGPYEAHLSPMFVKMAASALSLAGVRGGDRVLDVATGPGTLALQAAERAEVSAIDFAPAMVARVREKLAERGLRVDTRVGDAQDLPWPDESFHAAFCMFGLIFVPDPARGLAEMARVVRPGGRVTVGSWRPMDPKLQALVAVLMERLGAPPGPPLPFGDEADIRARFSAAGLRDVAVHAVSEHIDYATTEAFLDAMVESNAAIVATRAALGEERWAPIEAALRERVRGEWGAGPQRLGFDAWISMGTV